MATEEERFAKKQLQTEVLRAKVEKLTKEVYHMLEMRSETEEQKDLFKRFKMLDKKLDKLERRHEEKSEQLREEKEKVYDDLMAAIELDI